MRGYLPSSRIVNTCRTSSSRMPSQGAGSFGLCRALRCRGHSVIRQAETAVHQLPTCALGRLPIFCGVDFLRVAAGGGYVRGGFKPALLHGNGLSSHWQHAAIASWQAGKLFASLPAGALPAGVPAHWDWAHAQD